MPAWVAYVAPMATFMLMTTLEGIWPSVYPWLYGLKVIVISVMLGCLARPWLEIRPEAKVTVTAIAVGLLVFAEWILLDQWIAYPHLGSRVGYNPFTRLQGWILPVFLAFRFYGLVIMVPIMEEIFWRSFLLRYLSVPNFQRIPVGTFTWGAFAIASILFGLFHSEWLVAIICAAIYTLLLKATKSLYACIIAHSTTNLALGVYILTTSAWQYW